VLNCASENGCHWRRVDGRESWSRRGSRAGRPRGLDVIAGARSAWMVGCPRSMPWRAHVSRMNVSGQVTQSVVETVVRRIARPRSPRCDPSSRGPIAPRRLQGDQPQRDPWMRRYTESLFMTASVLLARLEHSVHAQRAVKLAVEGQHSRGGKSDV